MSADDPGGEPKFSPPWSSNTPYGRRARGQLDPAVQEVLRQAGRGKVDPLGFRADRAALIMTPARHNPYLNLPFPVLFGGMAWLVIDRVPLPWSIFAGGFFVLGSLLILVQSIRRIPSWHRARRMVADYLRSNPGTFPDELKWYQ